jgi:hypothetical protein
MWSTSAMYASEKGVPPFDDGVPDVLAGVPVQGEFRQKGQFADPFVW